MDELEKRSADYFAQEIEKRYAKEESAKKYDLTPGTWVWWRRPPGVRKKFSEADGPYEIIDRKGHKIFNSVI